MQRVAWTDERLDDLSRRMDAGFDRMDRDVRDLRSEMYTGFVDLRSETRAGFAEVRTEIEQLRTLMYRFGGVIVGTLVASMILHGI